VAVDLGIEHLSGGTLIGQGGFSAVYAATDERFDRRVAVKLFFRHTADRDRERFERECRIMGRLSAHPNVVTVHDAGHNRDGRPYLIMELVEGGSLAQQLAAGGPIPWPTAIDHLVPIAQALGHGHAQGILHRDVKPENILLDGDRPLLTDFGIASIHGVTSSTMVSASWSHSPPETFRDRRDERSDIYSLASTLHTLVTGRSPFSNPADESLGPLVHRLLYEPPPRMGPDVAPPALADLVVRSLAKDPAERPQTADEMIEALTAIRSAAAPAPAQVPVRAAATTSAGGPPAAPGWAAPTGTAVVSMPAERPVSMRVGPWSQPLVDPMVERDTVRSSRRRRRAWMWVWVMPVLVALAAGGAWYGASLARGAEDEQADPGTGSAVQAPPTSEAAAPLVTEPPPATDATVGPSIASVQWNAGPFEVSGVAGLPDGRVAVGGSDGLVRLFDPADPDATEVSLRGHGGPVWQVQALSDGRLVSSSDDGTVRVWDPAQPDAEPDVLGDASEGPMRGIVELADGRLAVARLDGLVAIWDLTRPDAEPVYLEGHTDSARDVTQLPDGRLVSGGDDQTIRVWDLTRPTADPALLEGHTESVWSLVALPDGRLASAGGDGTIRVWNADRPGDEPLVLRYPNESLVRRIVLTPDGRIAAVNADAGISLWETREVDGGPARVDDEVQTEEEVAVAVGADGRLITGSRSGEVRVRPVPPR